MTTLQSSQQEYTLTMPSNDLVVDQHVIYSKHDGSVVMFL